MSSQLEAIYARIPDVPCIGHCARYCGPIMCSTAEAERLPGPHRRIRTPLGLIQAEIPHVERKKGRETQLRCVHLRNGRCTVYQLRPAICRIWGATQELRCPYGCEPERWLTKQEANEILLEIAAAA